MRPRGPQIGRLSAAAPASAASPRAAPARIKEKELRLALVCYGGVSLAIYQHGITKEILKLVRASRAYHAAKSPAEKQQPEHRYRPTRRDGAEHSTEEIYFDFLKAVGAGKLDLRVIVDVIAGASSGGINGIVLARALAHDLPIEGITEVWLSDVDVANLLAPEAKAKPWHKWWVRPFVQPFLWELRRKGLLASGVDRESRGRLSMFLRSRWFEPPLDGARLSAMLLDAMERMGEPNEPTASLVPAGQRLDLAVTVTDYYGADRLIHLHDPPVVLEREHRQVLRFSAEHLQTGSLRSDFGLDNVPALAFAARATSSYPGAFPPARVREIDAVLAARGRAWLGRAAFIDANFAHYRAMGLDPEDIVVVDGSVLDNKPFRLAIEAIRSHTAFREVDRRVVYIDPHPKKPRPTEPGVVPGFFTTIRGALSDLPRYDPINDELVWIGELNQEARRERAALEAVRPDVAARVERIAGPALSEPVTAEQLRRWRLDAGRVLIEDSRLMYNQYVRLMIGEALIYLTRLVATICGYAPSSAQGRWVAAALEAWAKRQGIFQRDYAIPPSATKEADLPLPLTFLVGLNLDYRYRRLYFVIHTINRFYTRLADPEFASMTSGTLDVFKREVYACLEALQTREGAEFLSPPCRAVIRELFSEPKREGQRLPELLDTETFVAQHDKVLTALIDRIGHEGNFVGFNEDSDGVLSSPAFHALSPMCRRGLLIAYIGFVFWDIIILPMLGAQRRHKLGELGEIIVDRISPDDSTTIRAGDMATSLRGADFAHFGAFLSRTARENDYLWGRLDGVDRLLDLLVSACGRDVAAALDLRAFKKRAFEAVLAEEGPRLASVADLLARLRQIVAEL
jgi:patatin-related protein